MTNDATPSGPDFDSGSADEDGIPVPKIADRVELEQKQRTIAARLFGEASALAPVRVGRYVVLRRMGEGGMGVVYSAYDESLDRKVALKLLRAGSPAARRKTEARLAREAKAMARLSHPNVATVYEVGRHGQEVFIAMELVEGQTLRGWLGKSHPAADILRVLVRAGRGLAAAHQAGLVHRDFKPDNVMVSDPESLRSAERVKVMDFGLAAGFEASTDDETGTSTPDARRVDEPLTVQGRVVGTPAYMSPEQLRGKELDARSDQFSFCVTAYEALYGNRPFTSDSHEGLVAAMREPVPEPADARGTQRRILGVLRRGLQIDPDRRFADMDALLRALEHDPSARARRFAFALGGLVAVAASGWAAARLGQDEVCRQGHDTVAATWSPDRKQRIGAAFAATALPHAAPTWDLTSASIDDYTERWADAHTEACRATRVYGSQSESMLDLRTACLQRRFGELEALLDVLERPDPLVVAEVLPAVAELPDLAPCSNARTLSDRVPLPDDPQAREQIESLRAEIEDSEATLRVGRYLETKRAAKPLLARAEGLGHPPLLGRARLLMGRASIQAGDEREGRDALKRAVFAAEASGDGELLAHAAIRLADSLASAVDDYAGALDYLTLAEAAMQRAGDVPSLQLEWHHARGEVLRRKGDYDEAEAELQRALHLAEQQAPPRPHIAARERSILARIVLERGQWDAALADLQEATEMYERELGPTHPASAEMRGRLASIFVTLQRWDDAEREATIAIERFERALGDDYIHLQGPLSSRASAYMRTGRTDEAEQDLRRALEIVRAHRGAGSVVEANLLENLARLHHRRGELDEAEQALRRALAVTRERRGSHRFVAEHLHTLSTVLAQKGELDEADALLAEIPAVLQAAGATDHPLDAMALSQRGRLAQMRGDLDQAERLYRQAIARFEQIHRGPHNNTAVALSFVADIQMQRGEKDAAQQTYEKALQHIEGADGDNPMIGGIVRFSLARLLWSDPTRRERALTLAQKAHTLLAPIDQSQATPIVTWLEQRGHAPTP